MERLPPVLVGNAKRLVIGGREHLSVPIVMLVPGVLNGSRGSLYYPQEEVARNYQQWNGVPLTLYHPTVNGRPASGKEEEALRRHGLGRVMQVKLRKSDGALTGNGLFDVDLVLRRDATLPDHAKLYPRLVKGDPVEVSTGLFTENIPAAQGSHYNGKPYDYIARNYRSDHMAVLPDQIGACSVRDGCGAGVTNNSALHEAMLLNTKKKGGGEHWVTLSSGQHVKVSGGKLQFGGGESSTRKPAAKPSGKITKEHLADRPDDAKHTGLRGDMIRLNLKRARQAHREGNSKLAGLYLEQANKHRSGEAVIKTTSAKS